MNEPSTFEPSHLQSIIRPMTLADLPQVVEIDRLSFSLPWPSNSYRFELTQNDASHCWVVEIKPDKPIEAEDAKQAVDPIFPIGAKAGKDLAGFQNQSGLIAAILVLWLIEDEAHIATIAVHPSFRGQGLGRRLLLEALRDATERGATMSTLEVRENNQPAINLYHRLGYEIVGRRPRYYQDTHEDALIMTAEHISLPEIERLLGDSHVRNLLCHEVTKDMKKI